MSLKFCIIVESNSQKNFFSTVLFTNMAAVTSLENREFQVKTKKRAKYTCTRETSAEFFRAPLALRVLGVSRVPAHVVYPIGSHSSKWRLPEVYWNSETLLELKQRCTDRRLMSALFVHPCHANCVSILNHPMEEFHSLMAWLHIPRGGRDIKIRPSHPSLRL